MAGDSPQIRAPLPNVAMQDGAQANLLQIKGLFPIGCVGNLPAAAPCWLRTIIAGFIVHSLEVELIQHAGLPIVVERARTSSQRAQSPSPARTAAPPPHMQSNCAHEDHAWRYLNPGVILPVGTGTASTRGVCNHPPPYPMPAQFTW